MLRTVKGLLIIPTLMFAAACSSINIEAPTGVDRGFNNGAGAGGGDL